MNRGQRIVAFVGLLVIAGMLLFPPFETGQYSLIFFPPHYNMQYVSGLYSAKIDTQRLGIQCVIVAIVTGAMLLLLGTRKPSGSD